MKKLFFALMAAVMMFMVSCGAAEGVQDGEKAAKEYAEAFKSGNPQAILDAYNSIAKTYGTKYQSAGTVALAGYMGGLSGALDKADPKINGSYYGITLANAKAQNLPSLAEIQKAVEEAKKQSSNAAAFQEGVDLAASWYAAPAAQEEAAEEPAAAEEGAEEGDAE